MGIIGASTERSSSAGGPDPGRRARVLVVDDDKDTRELLAELLAQAGYEVEVAENGRAALARLGCRRRRPTLLLLDLMMPELDGWSVLRALRDVPMRNVRVVVLSAAGIVAAPIPGVRWLQKPIAPDELVMALRAADGDRMTGRPPYPS